jgi:peptidoglycan hydrolase-like protein with peptidoglycan-binding domain
VNSSGTSTYPTDTTFTTNTCPIIVGGGSAVGTWSASSVVQTPANQNNTVVSTPNQAQPPMPTTPVQTPPTSGQNLTIMASQSLIIGDNSNNVLLLQQYLNKNGYTVATTGPGSSGNETTKFGSLTKSALMKFQKANHLPVTGFFGPKTRALIMSW